MKRLFLFVLVFAFTSLDGSSIPENPKAEISNGLIRAKIYLPDAKNGYYRGARFDWSGVIPELEFKGHTYFGKWFKEYNPTTHDAIMGPVEAFSPLGYEQAKAGETFVKIGIGSLAKPDDSAYRFTKSYEILDPGQWEVKQRANQIQFVHKFEDTEYAYDYEKIVQLVEGESRMVLKHTLKNKGRKTIETDVYNHNFFVIDGQQTGPDFTMKFPFLISTDGKIKNDLMALSKDEIIFKKKLEGEASLFLNLNGFGATANDYDFRIENRKTGAGVRITGDQPLSKVDFWSIATTLCPEPYIHVKVAPGAVFNWEITYDFYLLNSVVKN